MTNGLISSSVPVSTARVGEGGLPTLNPLTCLHRRGRPISAASKGRQLLSPRVQAPAQAVHLAGLASQKLPANESPDTDMLPPVPWPSSVLPWLTLDRDTSRSGEVALFDGRKLICQRLCKDD